MDDARLRCPWGTGDPLHHAYHDAEWGVPIHHRHLYELLNLEGAQAGLSWITILRKRDGYRRRLRGLGSGAHRRLWSGRRGAAAR